MMMFGFLFLILFVVILVAGVIAGLVWLNKNNRQGNPFNVNQPSGKREQIPGPDTKRFVGEEGALWENHLPSGQCPPPQSDHQRFQHEEGVFLQRHIPEYNA